MKNNRARMIFKTIDLKYNLELRRDIPYDELLKIRRANKEALRQINRQGCTFEDEEDQVINSFKIMGAKKITRKHPKRGRDYKTTFLY